MDHLPYISGKAGNVLKVPYLVIPRWDYSGDELFSFPSRKNVDERLLQAGDLQGHSWAECLSFLQSWLYFGLVIDIFQTLGVNLLPTDFLRDDADGAKVIDTAIYPRLIIMWEMMERGTSESGRASRLSRIDASVSLVRKFIENSAIPEWSHEFSKEGMRDAKAKLSSPSQIIESASAGTRVLLSIVWLLETISLGRHTAYSRGQRNPPTIGNEGFSKLKSHKLADILLLRSGWCPYEINTWRTQGNNSTRWYFSQFQRAEEPDDHSQCTIKSCTLSAMDKGAYRTRHVVEGCACPFLHSVQIDEELDAATDQSVPTIINQGHVPLVFVVSTEEQDELEVISSEKRGFRANVQHWHQKNNREGGAVWAVRNPGSKPVVKYVAISHVWHSGLGNPHSNSLPRCQLVRIQKLVNAQYPQKMHPVPFWMDTLCVPQDRGLRKKAIQAMKSIYQQADKVLVLDSTLQHNPLSADPLVNLTRIRFCAWTQRLWTYQEGILASELIFQFRDQAIMGEDLVKQLEVNNRKFYSDHIKDIRHMLFSRWTPRAALLYISRGLISWQQNVSVDHPWLGRGGPLPRIANLVARDAKRSFKRLRIAESKYTGTLLRKKTDCEALSDFSHPLQWRKTTKPKDEALVLATLIGLDLKSLLDARSELTLKHIFQHMNMAPVDVLFVAREHFQEQGCRWMPTSLIDGRGLTTLGPAKGTVTKEGLIVDLPGLLVSNLDTSQFQSSTSLQIHGRSYVLCSAFLAANDDLQADGSTSTTSALVLKRTPGKHTYIDVAILANVRKINRRWEGIWAGCTQLVPHTASATTSDAHTAIFVSETHESTRWCIS